MNPPLRPRHSEITIADAIDDPQLLGAALDDPASWQTWRTVLKAAFGLALTPDEAQTFTQVAGNRNPPNERVRELWAIVGRRGGKSRVAAALALHLAAFTQHRLAKGEVGMVLVLAASRDQAQTVFNYVKGFLKASPILRHEIANITRTEIELKNGIVIGSHANSFRTVRGRTLIAAILDEVAFWRDESSANPDIEAYRAILPSLATTSGLLVGISTPYRKVGLLHMKHRDHYGIDGNEVLVVKGSTRQFNPTLSDVTIATQRKADPTAASSEWDAEFRDDLAGYLDDELIDAAVEPGRPRELPPRGAVFYKAFVDASGGTGVDSYTLSIAHKEGERFVVDVVRGTRPGQKFDPQQVTREFAQACKEYRISSVVGDHYGAEWVAGAWRDAGINYVRSERPKSQLYLETLPLWTRGLVSIPDHPRLLRELRLLERQVHRGGRDSVDHPRGGHDDFANAVCGVLHSLSDRVGFCGNWDWVTTDDSSPADPKQAEREAADRFHASRLQSYLARFGAFGRFP